MRRLCEILLPLIVACGDPSARVSRDEPSASAGVPNEPARWTAVVEVSWDDAVRAIREKRPVTAIQTKARRVHLSLPKGAMKTTAPDETALARLLAEVDPDRRTIGTSNWYALYEEVDWASGEQILRGGKVNWVEDNDCGRLLIQLFDEPRNQVLTYAPPGTNVEKLITEIDQRPLVVRHQAIPEIRWGDAEDRIRSKEVSVTSLHGRRIVLRDAKRKLEWSTFEPGLDVAAKLVRELGGIDLTVE